MVIWTLLLAALPLWEPVHSYDSVFLDVKNEEITIKGTALNENFEIRLREFKPLKITPVEEISDKYNMFYVELRQSGSLRKTDWKRTFSLKDKKGEEGIIIFSKIQEFKIKY